MVLQLEYVSFGFVNAGGDVGGGGGGAGESFYSCKVTRPELLSIH